MLKTKDPDMAPKSQKPKTKGPKTPLAWVRPNIRALAPYSTARDDYKGGAIDTWLDANESPYPSGVNRYPDPRQKALKKQIAQLKGVTPQQTFIGNGSDEAIDLCYRIFCRPGKDNAVAITPSYGMYRVGADINDIKLREVELNPDFSLPVDRLLEATDENTRLMWICSPNNPTANAFPIAQIEELLERFDGMVIVDEAYVDFSDQGSILPLLDKHPNLIVLQTLSKAWGMAALRLGLAFGAEQVMELFGRVKYPYNISAIVQDTVARLLESEDKAAHVAEIKAERDRLAEAIKPLPCVLEVYPSDANFLLVKVTDPIVIYDRLIDEGVIVRDRSRMPLCHGCLRITIGTPHENKKVISILSTLPG